MTAQPNILIFMVDQLTGTLFPDGPANWLHTPNLSRLADRSLRFQAAYTASPLCAPGRAGFMTGQLPSAHGIFDNAAEFRSDIPTFAHHLRRAGYSTCLCGKMHFVGPDQLHGFEERLTTDIYPADFGWTPDYTQPGKRIEWWYHNMGSVTGAGVAETTNQLEYDDEVAFFARQKLYDLAREKSARPWCLTVSFTHPHDPYVARPEFWDLYENCRHLLPQTPALDYADHDPHSQRIFDANDWRNYTITPSDIRQSRRAYFANISYLDRQIGEVLAVLDRTGNGDNTVIVFVSDHGDMLGERGLWFKMCFYEGSVRVPLMIALPGASSGKSVQAPVSTMDVGPTLMEIAGLEGGRQNQVASLLDLPADGRDHKPVYMEYAAEASIAPLVGIRHGAWKYIHCKADPPQLYNIADDPAELTNRAGDAAVADVAADMAARVHKKWDLSRYDADVRNSQARRLIVYEALRNGDYFPWDYQPLKRASERFMRNHKNLDQLENAQRQPVRDP